MTMLEQTLPASFKGIPFLVDGTTTTGGKKTAKHTFPNSSNQVIEKLGKKQKTYVVRGFIQNDFHTDDYNEKKEALIDALDSDENGVLIHPWFGHVENITNTNYVVSETFGRLGIATFTMTFEVDLLQSIPKVAGNTLSQVESLMSTVKALLNDDLAEDYVVDFFNNVSDSIEQIEGWVDYAQDSVRIFAITSQELDELATELSDIATDVVDLINTPKQLADSIQNVFSTMAGAYASIDAAFDVVSDFWGFGDIDTDINPDTSSKQERKTNREVFNRAINSFSLTESYTLASKLEFQTINEQQEIAVRLEEQYDRVVGDPQISTDAIAAITDQRIAVEKLFDENRITLGRIVQVKTQATSARLLSYQYYGESLSGESIAVLNNYRDASFIPFGDISVVTS